MSVRPHHTNVANLVTVAELGRRLAANIYISSEHDLMTGLSNSITSLQSGI